MLPLLFEDCEGKDVMGALAQNGADFGTLTSDGDSCMNVRIQSMSSVFALAIK
jgi:hypothetical protein